MVPPLVRHRTARSRWGGRCVHPGERRSAPSRGLYRALPGRAWPTGCRCSGGSGPPATTSRFSLPAHGRRSVARNAGSGLAASDPPSLLGACATYSSRSTPRIRRLCSNTTMRYPALSITCRVVRGDDKQRPCRVSWILCCEDRRRNRVRLDASRYDATDAIMEVARGPGITPSPLVSPPAVAYLAGITETCMKLPWALYELIWTIVPVFGFRTPASGVNGFQYCLRSSNCGAAASAGCTDAAPFRCNVIGSVAWKPNVES